VDNHLQIYQSQDGSLVLDVHIKNDSAWLTQAQMAELFGTQRPAITKHLGNIFKSGELEKQAVCSKMELTASDGKNYSNQVYNLDAIISVGYRINSINATRFRQWATQVLRSHLEKGYSIHKARLSQNAIALEKALLMVKRAAAIPYNKEFGAGLTDIITSYTQTFLWLQQYDEGLLEKPKGQSGGKLTPLPNAKKALHELKHQLIAKNQATALFAAERNDGLATIWGTLEQSVFGEPAYPSIESKAAHLLYFVVKNHPFSDGNKRSAALLFIDFLNRNDRLFDADYTPVINDTGLAALTLLVAESSPQEKETIIRLIENLLALK
jgi:prophage maintenance system killer protein